MNTLLKPLLVAALVGAAAQASAQITFYESEGFHGRAFSTDHPVQNLQRFGFNDRASSVVVERGRWLVCEDARFEGRCAVLRRGSYGTLRSLGLDNRISSVRSFDPRHEQAGLYEPAPPAPVYEYRHRPDERLFEANVTSARAVVGPPEQRCWLERHEVAAPERDINVPGAVIGGVVGGILGHQVGGASGKDLATVGGAVGGAVLGANVDRIRDRTTGQEVRRCENVASTTPQYWDVTYNFRGVEHRVQMTSQPGATIPVNRDGQPRV
jgi:uncharacterized protein YcfJ